LNSLKKLAEKGTPIDI